MNWGRFIAVGIRTLLIVGVGCSLSGCPRNTPIAETPPPAAPPVRQFQAAAREVPQDAVSPDTESNRQSLVQSVTGAVQQPGLYRLPEKSRVQDAIDAAGGICQDADVTDINIAAFLIDGEGLSIPRRRQVSMQEGVLVAKRQVTARELNPLSYTRSGWQPLPSLDTHHSPAQEDGQPQTSGMINLNSASQEELETLPGIGPVTAAKIIAYRQHSPFQQVEDLMNVHGIGAKKLEAVADRVKVR